ncbi:SRPBCC family protein [Nonomuraea longicatena]|uniref:SRPBCC family protein n=1 Tax=Nonomuraea longicatena TaxID=83682 RepID=A0ABN1QF76_9ACTN
MSGSTDNSVWIAAPFDVTWKITNDVRNWPNLFTEYAAIDVLEEQGDTVTFRLTMVPDPDGSVWSWVSRRTSDRTGRNASAHRVETGPFEYMKIRWDYAEEDGGTRMRWRQEFAVKPEAPFDLVSITDRINRNTLIQMAVIKEKVEKAAAA